jgi:hypothetical protein
VAAEAVRRSYPPSEGASSELGESSHPVAHPLAVGNGLGCPSSRRKYRDGKPADDFDGVRLTALSRNWPYCLDEA